MIFLWLRSPTLERYCSVSSWDPCVKARQRSSPSNPRALTSHFFNHGRAVSRLSSSHWSAHRPARRATRHFCICAARSHTVSSRAGIEQRKNKCSLQLRQQSRLQLFWTPGPRETDLSPRFPLRTKALLLLTTERGGPAANPEHEEDSKFRYTFQKSMLEFTWYGDDIVYHFKWFSETSHDLNSAGK